MPATLRKNLNLCFTKWKPPLSPPQSLSPPFSATPTSTLIKNFNTLYDPTLHPSSSSSSSPSSTSSSSAAAAAADPDLAAAFASHRFFFSSPGHSNSIIDSTPPPASAAAAAAAAGAGAEASAPLVDDSVAVPTYSPDPYADFRRSMQEMVEARQLFDVKSDWDLLHELLLCYLSLNPKSTHKIIVGAFADLLVSLMSRPPRRRSDRGGGGGGGVEYARGGNGCKIYRRCSD